MKEKSDKINRFLLQEQFPDIIKVAGTDKRSNNGSNPKFSPAGTASSSAAQTSYFPKHSISRRVVTAIDHVNQLRLESCRCPHLQEYLPRILDLTVCRTTPSQRHPKGWTFANPIHALHMVASQSGPEPSSKTQKQRLPPTFLYGEEHHRTTALQTEGIAEYWCSFDGNPPTAPSPLQQQINAPTSSKLPIKSEPKLPTKNSVFSGVSGSPLPLRPGEIKAVAPLGSNPGILPKANTATSDEIKPLVPRSSSLPEQGSETVCPNNQVLAMANNHASTASTSLKLEPGQRESNTIAIEGTSSQNEPIVSSIKTEKNSDIQSELEPLPSHDTQSSGKSNDDLMSIDPKTEGKGKVEGNLPKLSSTDENKRETVRAEIPTESTSKTSVKMSSGSSSITTTTAQNTDERNDREAQQVNNFSKDSESSDPKDSSAPEPSKDSESSDPKQSSAPEPSKDSESSDTKESSAPEPLKDSESSDPKESSGPEPSKNSESSDPKESSAPEPSKDSESSDPKESSAPEPLKDSESSDPKESSAPELSKDSESSDPKESSAPEPMDENLAGHTSSAPESKELPIENNDTAEKSNVENRIESDCVLSTSQTNDANENEEKAKVDKDVSKEDMVKSGDSDLATKIDTRSENGLLSEENNDKVHKSVSIESTSTEIVTKKSEVPDAITTQDATSRPSIENVKKSAGQTVDPIGVKVTTATVATENQSEKKDLSSSASFKKGANDKYSEGTILNQDDLKATVATSLPQSTNPYPPKTTTTAGGGNTETPKTNKSIMNFPQNKHISQQIPTPFISDPSNDHFRREEEKIRRVRRSLMAKRVRKKPDPSPKEVVKKKRRISEKFQVMPGWKVPPIRELTVEEEEGYIDVIGSANDTVERWIRQFRLCHESYWKETEKQKDLQKQTNTFYMENDLEEERFMCRVVDDPKNSSRPFTGDELMQCLDCGFIGCSPPSLNSNSNRGMEQHLLLSGHKFAVSCGKRAQLYCFECGDCVYHEIFEQEKIRIACTKKIPHMAWNEHSVLRSFDPFQFLKTPDSGILWRGLVATYPPMVPKEHYCAAQLTLRRQALFDGSTHDDWILSKSNALYFAASQHLKADEERYKISAPVGIYNLGNTCFMSSILQCLVFCKPLQRYFLQDAGHHYKACEVFRHKEDLLTAAAAAAVTAPTKKIPIKSKKSNNVTAVKKKTSKIDSEVCLACEMDRLFLSYYGATVGNDVCIPIEESSQDLLLGHADVSPFTSLDEVGVPIEKGEPLIISDLLTSAWKSGGMNHLTGYDQHDAHEFLDSFLDILGKHIMKYRNRIYSAVTKVYKENAFVPQFDPQKSNIIKNLFEGSLRSVLLCENCGVKRVQQEPFMNVSLSLSEEVDRMQDCDLNVETCLQHFVQPEILGDLVYCNSCGKRTRTKKQHTFAKLPKILCLHLKRFDATKNKKIENFVSFPSHGLNMGNFLSHWCEVTRLGSTALDKEKETPTAEPKILYDLFGTVDHVGSMQSGHYVTNVKVDDVWYHCNDQHISYATEESVLKADGAYVLFYIRR